MERKQIVLYKAGCGITAVDLRALCEAGFIPIKVNDLGDVKVVDQLSDVDHGVIFNSAIKAILNANKDIGPKNLFATTLAEKLLGIEVPKAK